MRALVLATLATLVAAGGCSRTRACRAGTILVTVDAAGTGADSVQVTLSIDGTVKGTSAPYPLPLGGKGTLEIDLRGDYQAGRMVTVDVDALAGGAVVAHASQGKTLPSSCATLSIGFEAGGGGDDLATAAPPDLAMAGADLAPPPLVPSHGVGGFDGAAPDVTGGITAIDTTNLKIAKNGGAAMSDPHFLLVNNDAVYYVGAITFDMPVKVTGDKPLVIVAAGTVDIRAEIDAAASNTWKPGMSGVITPGPGGFGPGMGPGAGNAGSNGANEIRSGGGGSFGTSGGAGGASGAASGSAGTAGPINGDMLAQFYGGSGGGAGFQANACGRGSGGAGGGAVQISSAASIIVRNGGGIHVGGSGGLGGCSGNDNDGSGGGGSGGLVLLEAPAIQVAGTLAANGGGGGSGVDAMGNWSPGENAAWSAVVAKGGTGSGLSAGGNGAAGSTAATNGGNTSGGSGGGGGGAGRIWLHTRGTAPDTVGATISPAPMIDTTF